MGVKLFYWEECGGSCIQRPHPPQPAGTTPHEICGEELCTENKSKNILQEKMFLAC